MSVEKRTRREGKEGEGWERSEARRVDIMDTCAANLTN